MKAMFEMVQNYFCKAKLILEVLFIAFTTVAKVKNSTFIDCIVEPDYFVITTKMEVYLLEVHNWTSCSEVDYYRTLEISKPAIVANS